MIDVSFLLCTSIIGSSPNNCWLIRCDVLGRVLTIDDFPDDVLVEIFDFYVVSCQNLDFRQLVKYRIKKEIES